MRKVAFITHIAEGQEELVEEAKSELAETVRLPKFGRGKAQVPGAGALVLNSSAGQRSTDYPTVVERTIFVQGISIKVDAPDASGEFTVLVDINGGHGPPDAVGSLLAGDSESFSITADFELAKGDGLTVRMMRKDGPVQASAFKEIEVLLVLGPARNPGP